MASFFYFLHCRNSRKRKAEEESDDEDSEEEEDYASSDDESVDEEDEEVLSDCEVEDDNTGTKTPTIHRTRDWMRKDFTKNAFQSVDGDKISSRWGQSRLSYEAGAVLSKGQRSLVRKQDERIVTLEPTFRRKTKLTQVPYRKCGCFLDIIIIHYFTIYTNSFG